ncbi:uncharacterized protein DUF4280 [Aneurinibacillus soli]|uniref:Uncharacterized protein n=1 Tax=Aneurinibacillus soli TaxID=1500254 RepID=A0A0U5AY71_9BACL|nr:DUF4280 domain-containing protein [Aneurinibacillus soli]PYE62640.1 uncharacterized protein DUF4280 [Aneurinibacillus soli]BAU27202.1 hypothetical protein CB4_01371 [Aneurinibacillus soli]
MNVDLFDNGGEGQSYVVAGAVLACSYGNMKSQLNTPHSHGVYIRGKAQMNIMDYKPAVHIMPFGTCGSMANPAVAAATAANNGILTRMPCTPVITMPWINGKSNVLIEKSPALLNICTNHCMYSGVITIEKDGQ